MEDRKVKQILSRGWHQREERRVNLVLYYVLMYENGK
jgi:hypothetical protein